MNFPDLQVLTKFCLLLVFTICSNIDGISNLTWDFYLATHPVDTYFLFQNMMTCQKAIQPPNCLISQIYLKEAHLLTGH
jgi:uncharacterized membrane protein